VKTFSTRKEEQMIHNIQVLKARRNDLSIEFDNQVDCIESDERDEIVKSIQRRKRETSVQNDAYDSSVETNIFL